jgi:hypothetical protein
MKQKDIIILNKTENSYNSMSLTRKLKINFFKNNSYQINNRNSHQIEKQKTIINYRKL